MSQSPVISLKPMPKKSRVSIIFVYYGCIDVNVGAFVVLKECSGKCSNAVLHAESVNWLLFPIKGY
jgi:hypothetical protein